jgi:hypothetical protein
LRAILALKFRFAIVALFGGYFFVIICYLMYIGTLYWHCLSIRWGRIFWSNRLAVASGARKKYIAQSSHFFLLLQIPPFYLFRYKQHHSSRTSIATKPTKFSSHQWLSLLEVDAVEEIEVEEAASLQEVCPHQFQSPLQLAPHSQSTNLLTSDKGGRGGGDRGGRGGFGGRGGMFLFRSPVHIFEVQR